MGAWETMLCWETSTDMHEVLRAGCLSDPWDEIKVKT